MHQQRLLVAGQSRAQTEEEHVVHDVQEHLVHDVQGRSSYTACEACQQGQHCAGNESSAKHCTAAIAKQRT